MATLTRPTVSKYLIFMPMMARRYAKLDPVSSEKSILLHGCTDKNPLQQDDKHTALWLSPDIELQIGDLNISPHNVNLSKIRDDNLRIRLERAWSWIDLAQSHENFPHARFIFYWIAFNAMYGLEPPNPMNQEEPSPDQMKDIRKFLKKLKRVITICGEKERGLLYQHVDKMKGSLELLITDSFLSRKYWTGQESPRSVTSKCASDWEKTDEQMRTNRLDFDKVFHIPCSRLLVLRNQIVHGSARGDTQSRGFPSLKKGLQVIEKMVPAFFDLLTRFGDSSEKWPKAPYPRWGHPEHPHEYIEGEPHELLGNRPKSN